MSLGLFAAIVVLLEQRSSVTVPQLEQELQIRPECIRAVLMDIYVQGHCALQTDENGWIVAATWRQEPACA